MMTPSTILPGHILWLLPLGDDNHADPSIPPGCYNHPVLILATDYQTQSASVLIVNLPSFDPKKNISSHPSSPKTEL